jgi:hypothetical protein
MSCSSLSCWTRERTARSSKVRGWSDGVRGEGGCVSGLVLGCRGRVACPRRLSRKLPRSPAPTPNHTTPFHAGLWRGSVVAVKTQVLPAKMSGAEKRERMAVMEAAISSTMCV